MGRRKKYLNDIEKKAAANERVKRFYWAHKEECDRKARERYLRKKLAARFNAEETIQEEVEQVMVPNEQ